jgi:23S rRNA (adenine2030-N6)-methyltransferase
MNYQHAYHAGNHTEVFKHSVLCLLLAGLQRKPRPFAVLDTHAGAGIYDLLSSAAQKTGEARTGIAVVFNKRIPTASRYLDLVRSMNTGTVRYYPGSPALIGAFLRENDRLIACELRADDAALLRAKFKGDRRVHVHHRDGYQAVKAFLPPPERRGLVFIDPPFEQADEFNQLADILNVGLRKWSTGIFAAWYPIKDVIPATRSLLSQVASYSASHPTGGRYRNKSDL